MGDGEPQSNQRGIETTVGWLTLGEASSCLNRTSVGLKRAQSHLATQPASTCLNRTSVGLKRPSRDAIEPY